MERTLKYVYIPIVKNGFEFDNEKFDVMLENYVDYIPFYEEQNFDKEMRYKVAKLLHMFNLAEYFGVIDDYDIEDLDKEELYLLINQEARSNTKEYTSTNLIKNKIFEDFVEWYNKQDIDFIELDLKDEEYTIRYWNFSADVNTEELFKDEHQWKFDVKPWLILKPNHDYSYLDNDSLDFISLNFESYGSYYFDVKSKYLIAYLLEEHKIPNSILTLDFDYVPIEFEVEFEVDNKKASFYWKPHDGCDYCINVKHLFTDLVSSEEEIEVDPNFLYDQIIEDHIHELENKYNFKAIVCGRSGGYFGFSRNDFKITDQIKVKVSTSLLVNTLLEEEKYSIDDLIYEVNKVIEDTIEDAIYYKEDLEDYVDIVEYVYNTRFIEFNKDLYRIIKRLSSGPELRSFEEYYEWVDSGYDNEELEKFRQKKEEINDENGRN